MSSADLQDHEKDVAGLRSDLNGWESKSKECSKELEGLLAAHRHQAGFLSKAANWAAKFKG